MSEQMMTNVVGELTECLTDFYIIGRHTAAEFSGLLPTYQDN